MNRYVVVHVTENSDLYHETYVDLEEALAFVDSIDDKALLIKIESDGVTPRVEVEDHT